MTRLYVARKDNNGKLVKGSHPSCLAAWPGLYANAGTEGYDTRVYIGTYMPKAAAQVYMKGFREAYKGGITFKRGDTEVNTPCPTLRYYDVDASGVYSSAEFGRDLKDVGQKGYFVINISSKCTEREAYVWLKMFAKPVTHPTLGRNVGPAFLKAYSALGNNWRAAIVALGLSNHNGGYLFPIGGSRKVEPTKAWLTGGLHVTSAYYPTDVPFGSPLTNGTHRTHTVSAQVMPRLVCNGGESFTFSPGQTLANAIDQVRQFLGDK